MPVCVRDSRAACLYFLLNSQCDPKLYWKKYIEGTKPVQPIPALQTEALDVVFKSSSGKFIFGWRHERDRLSREARY